MNFHLKNFKHIYFLLKHLKIFELLGRLVAHDVWFIWDRIGYLSNKDEDVLLQIPFSVVFSLLNCTLRYKIYFYFQWVPAPPPSQPEKKKSSKKDVSILSGFAMTPAKSTLEDLAETSQLFDYEKFPGLDLMKSYALKNVVVKENAVPSQCIIDIIKIQLQVSLVFKKISTILIKKLIRVKHFYRQYQKENE
jgi:hypothetical protein